MTSDEEKIARLEAQLARAEDEVLRLEAQITYRDEVIDQRNRMLERLQHQLAELAGKVKELERLLPSKWYRDEPSRLEEMAKARTERDEFFRRQREQET